MSATFEILLQELPVATLHAETVHTERTWITEWAPEWVAASPRPVVSLNLIDKRLNRARAWGTRLPPFLTNLLPEAESALRRRLARTHELDEADDVAFLSLLGDDLSGALRVRRIDPRPAPVRLRSGRPAEPLTGYRASLGGMQLKFSAHRGERVTLPAHGELSAWILKLPPAEHPRLPAWEAAALSWAQAVGFEVPEHHVEALSRVDGLPMDVQRSVSSCLVVRRFDRPGGERRLHMEEVCSILGLHPEAKYADGVPVYGLAAVGRIVHRFAGPEHASAFVERVVFDALVGNGDAHLKNWALTFPDGHVGRLAPVYDVVPTALLLDEVDLALPLRGRKAPRFQQVHPAAVRDLARAVGLDADAVHARAVALVQRAQVEFDGAVAPWGLSEAERLRWHAHLASVASAWA